MLRINSVTYVTKQLTTCKQIRIAVSLKLTAAIPVAYATPMQKILIKNRRAFFDYEILERYEAGIVLKGHEVKSLKTQGGNFAGAYVSLMNGEAMLKGFNIPLYSKSTLDAYEATKPRKLLLRKAEILKLSSSLNTKGVTLIPLICGLNNGKIKIEIALGRGKKNYDKRHSLKKKDQERRIRDF